MHELSIATNIVDIVNDNLASYPEAKVNSVTVQIGTHSGVEPDALKFCFPLACEQTPVQGAKLILVIVPLKVSCQDCKSNEIQAEVLACPKCHSANVIVDSGKDMIVASIDLEVEE